MGLKEKLAQAREPEPAKGAAEAPQRMMRETTAWPPNVTPAWFTERELTEMRKIVRDSDNELGVKILAEAIKRADRS